MKKLFVILLISISLNVFSQNSNKTNSEKYLINLDHNLVTSIETLQTFNDILANMNAKGIKQLKSYNQLLMSFIVDYSEQRRLVLQANENNSYQQNLMIGTIIYKLLKGQEIDRHFTEVNEKYLEQMTEFLLKSQAILAHNIIEEEKKIAQKGELTPIYLVYHTDHYQTLRLLDYLKPYKYLSEKNKLLLANVLYTVFGKKLEK